MFDVSSIAVSASGAFSKIYCGLIEWSCSNSTAGIFCRHWCAVARQAVENGLLRALWMVGPLRPMSETFSPQSVPGLGSFTVDALCGFDLVRYRACAISTPSGGLCRTAPPELKQAHLALASIPVLLVSLSPGDEVGSALSVLSNVTKTNLTVKRQTGGDLYDPPR